MHMMSVRIDFGVMDHQRDRRERSLANYAYRYARLARHGPAQYAFNRVRGGRAHWVRAGSAWRVRECPPGE